MAPANKGYSYTEWIVFTGDSPNSPDVVIDCDVSLEYAERVQAAIPGSRIAWRRVIHTGWSIMKEGAADATE